MRSLLKNFNPLCAKETELLMLHGKIDPMVLHEWANNSFNLLKSVGVRGNLVLYDELGHGVIDEEIIDCLTFISKIKGNKSKL